MESILQSVFPSKDRNANAPQRSKHTRSLVESVVEQVTQKITSGELVPGQKIPTEQEMMQAYGVSRTVVREAISRLQAGELVETHHGIGTFILDYSERAAAQMMAPSLTTMFDILDMLEFRICLETQAAGLTALKRTDDDVTALVDTLHAFTEQVHKGANASAADIDFHTLICKATGNRYFGELYRFIGHNTIPRVRLKIAQYAQEPETVYLIRIHSEHMAVHDAIVRQDAESAQAAMRMHLVNSRERLLKAMELERLQNPL